MKPINILLTILFISLLSSPSWSMTLVDLVERDDLYYEKFTDIPFSGKVTGREQGAFESGKNDCAWVECDYSGQLFSKGHYKKGKREVTWAYYCPNGQLWLKGNRKTGYKEGNWVEYYCDGDLWEKGDYKNGRRDDYWVSYNEDGSVDKEYTGTFKDGEKISDWVNSKLTKG